MVERNTIGQAMRECRKRRKISQRDIEDTCGIARSLMSRYENDQVYPNLLTLISIADALDVTLDELIGRDVCDTKSRDPES